MSLPFPTTFCRRHAQLVNMKHNLVQIDQMFFKYFFFFQTGPRLQQLCPKLLNGKHLSNWLCFDKMVVFCPAKPKLAEYDEICLFWSRLVLIGQGIFKLVRMDHKLVQTFPQEVILITDYFNTHNFIYIFTIFQIIWMILSHTFSHSFEKFHTNFKSCKLETLITEVWFFFNWSDS